MTYEDYCLLGIVPGDPASYVFCPEDEGSRILINIGDAL
jgi:hypothetical protein